MASTRLSRTVGAGNRQTWTWSGWVKRSKLTYDSASLLGTYVNANDQFNMYFSDADELWMFFYNGTSYYLKPNVKYRDTSAWYHIVAVADTTNATSSDRWRIYVNGERMTDVTENQPTQNLQMSINDSNTMEVGSFNSTKYFDGEMAHVHFIDGTAYDADTFGETDATTGIWKPKTAPSVTYGTNGFFLKFENSGSMGTDSSGNGNNFTVNGTMTQTIDTPSNVFCTMNPLNVPSLAPTFENGNTVCQTNTGDPSYFAGSGTLGVSSGKWYWEIKCISGSDSGYVVGVTGNVSGLSVLPGFPGQTWDTEGYGYYAPDGHWYNNGSDQGAYGNTYTTNDIISIALDLDNNKLYFAKNGTWQNSGDPTSGATGTGALSITDPASTTGGYYHATCGSGGSATYHKYGYNFGNGYFGTTPVSSAENPDDGIGIFEYSVPTGYRALCTKSINAEEYS